MSYESWMLAALLVAAPALANETEFQGHAIEAGGPAGARQVMRVRGSLYSIPGTPAQIVGKAQLCMSRRDSKVGIVSTDPAGGRVVAVSRVEYRQQPLPAIVKSRLAVEAGDGNFRIVLSNLGTTQGHAGDTVEEVFSPLLMRADSDWEPALVVVIGVEQALLDCMFS